MNDHDLMTTMRESFTDVQSATPVERIVRRSQAIRARRRIPGALAVVAVAAAAGTAVALVPAGSAKPAAVSTKTTAYVVGHVTRALDAMPGNTVVLIQWTQAGTRDLTDMWTNGEGGLRQETLTPAGQPVSEIGISVSHSGVHMTRKAVFVYYGNKTWSSSVHYFANVKPRPATVWTCSNAETVNITRNPGEMAGLLHTELSCGELKVAGNGTAGGVPAVELSGDSHGAAVTYWVNATTYLPYRFTWTFGGQSLQENLQWLPPTAANLAKVNVPIPAGFTHVPPPGNGPSS
jgi:hypothetical protein